MEWLNIVLLVFFVSVSCNKKTPTLRRLNAKVNMLQMQTTMLQQNVHDIWNELSDAVVNDHNNDTSQTTLDDSSRNEIFRLLNASIADMKGLKLESEQLVMYARKGIQREKAYNRDAMARLANSMVNITNTQDLQRQLIDELTVKIEERNKEQQQIIHNLTQDYKNKLAENKAEIQMQGQLIGELTFKVEEGNKEQQQIIHNLTQDHKDKLEENKGEIQMQRQLIDDLTVKVEEGNKEQQQIIHNLTQDHKNKLAENKAEIQMQGQLIGELTVKVEEGNKEQQQIIHNLTQDHKDKLEENKAEIQMQGQLIGELTVKVEEGNKEQQQIIHNLTQDHKDKLEENKGEIQMQRQLINELTVKVEEGNKEQQQITHNLTQDHKDKLEENKGEIQMQRQLINELTVKVEEGNKEQQQITHNLTQDHKDKLEENKGEIQMQRQLINELTVKVEEGNKEQQQIIHNLTQDYKNKLAENKGEIQMQRQLIDELTVKVEEGDIEQQHIVHNLTQGYKSMIEGNKAEIQVCNNKSTSVEQVLDGVILELKDVEQVAERNKKILSCDDGWKSFLDHCYFFSSEAMTWDKALEFCQNNESSLLEIDMDEEVQFILDTPTAANHLWLGAHDRAEEGQFTWQSSKRPVLPHLWSKNEPNNHGNEDCVEIYNHHEGRLNDNKCSRNFTFACEKNIRYKLRLKDYKDMFEENKAEIQVCNNKSTSVEQVLDGVIQELKGVEQVAERNKKILSCDDGWKSFLDHCYFFSSEVTTWDKAMEFCQNNESSLLEIDMDEEVQFILDTPTAGHRLWLGAHDRAEEGQFTWLSSKRPVLPHLWYNNEPNNGGNNEDCVEIYKHYDGKLNDYVCSRNLNFACEKNIRFKLW